MSRYSEEDEKKRMNSPSYCLIGKIYSIKSIIKCRNNIMEKDMSYNIDNL